MIFRQFFDQISCTYTYLIASDKGREALIIDPVLEKTDQYIKLLNELELKLVKVIDTHIHADHLTAAQFVKRITGAKVVSSKNGDKVQRHFDETFDLHSLEESLFDQLVNTGDELVLGNSKIEVMATPGHTQSCLSYIVRNDEQVLVFIGDTLFMPDVGTARCDFPGGDCAQLYQSIQNIYALGDDAVLYLCHDYPPNARLASASITVAQQKKGNIHCANGVSQQQFMAVRNGRDEKLAPPKLLFPSLQVNIRAGFLPEADNKGRRFLRIPMG